MAPDTDRKPPDTSTNIVLSLLNQGVSPGGAIGAAAGISMGIALTMAHPEWAAAYLHSLPADMVESARQAADQVVGQCPIAIRDEEEVEA